MRPILRVGNTYDLANNQISKINIWVCRNKRQRADTEFIRNSVKRIPRSDGIATRVFLTTVNRHTDTSPRPQASWIEPWISLQNAFSADIKFLAIPHRESHLWITYAKSRGEDTGVGGGGYGRHSVDPTRRLVPGLSSRMCCTLTPYACERFQRVSPARTV
jgi:hypothetical protein